MKTDLFRTLVALLIPFGASAFAHGDTTGVRDVANMFSTDAIQQANTELERIHQTTGWPILIETIEGLEGKPIDDVALQKARSMKIEGVYVLLADKEHRLSIQVPKKAAAVFNSSVRDTLKRTITSAFKQGNFNQGLLDGIAYLAKVSAEHPSSVAVAPTQPRERLPAGGDQKGRGSFLMTALIVGGVVLLVLFVIRLLSGAGRPGMSGAGAPGGGGFLSSLFGAMGGVFLGNWLYNTFGGGHAHASDAGRSDAQSHDASDQYESTSGGWDGGETGGDSGGFDGGDFGGGDGGGGGGGDW